MHPAATRFKMSDDYGMPFHLQEEIMKKLPVKSLVQFRSVSKAWKCLIDSSHFIAAHCVHSHTQPQHLLVGYQNRKEYSNCVCFVDDETLFQQRTVPNCPPYVKENILTNIIGISHGLVCFYCPKTKLAGIWNPSIRKSIDVAVPNTPYVGEQFVGFGVCPVTIDPKIVAIKQSWDKLNIESTYRCKVMVYSLSLGKWRSLSTNLPTTPLQHCWEVAVVDRFIYWPGGSPGCNMIISFDVTNESFQMIDLPTTLARHGPYPLHIYKLRESLVIIQDDGSTYRVWKMEGGVQRSFIKLFPIYAPFYSLMGFRKSGVPIMLVEDDEQIILVVYVPNSEHNNVFEICESSNVFNVNSYTETLLLLGRFDCSSY